VCTMNNLKWLAVVPAALAVVFLLVGLTWTEWPQFLLGVGLLGLAAGVWRVRWRVASLVCIAPADPGVGNGRLAFPLPPLRRRISSAVGLVAQPPPDDPGEELGLRNETQGGIERLGVLGLQPDVLARHLVE
jgi:hypothetical protein